MAARKPAGEKTKRLNVFLLKPEVQTFDDALESPQSWQAAGLPMTIDGRSCMLYARSKPGRKADWVTMLESGLPGQATPFQNANSWNHSALLVIEIKDRFFAVAFGYGATFLKRDCWEPRFGLKVALNLADEANLQQAAFKTHEGKTMSREVSSSRLTGFYDFGFDSEKDFLRKLTAKLKKDHKLGLRITGKDSVSLVCPAKLDDLPTKCRQLRVESWRKRYKAHFPDIENVIPVDDKTIVAGLVAELDLAFATPNVATIHFSIPDIIDYDRYAGLRIADNANLIDDLSVATIQAELGGNPLTFAAIQRVNVKAEDDQGVPMGDGWFLAKCCIAEVTYQGKTYLLTEGQWLACDAAYVQKLNAFVNAISITTHLNNVPRNGQGSENAYLEDLATKQNHGYLVAHKQLVQYGGGQSKLELCDLYTVHQGKTLLIHVKGGGGATEFGHLVHQGLNSLELLIDEDREFANLTVARLQARSQANNVVLPAQLPSAGADYKVVFAVFQGQAPQTPADGLTLFGKISLRRSVKALRKFGCDVSLEWVLP